MCVEWWPSGQYIVCVEWWPSGQYIVCVEWWPSGQYIGLLITKSPVKFPPGT